MEGIVYEKYMERNEKECKGYGRRRSERKGIKIKRKEGRMEWRNNEKKTKVRRFSINKREKKISNSNTKEGDR